MQTFHIVQPFEKQGKKLVPARPMEFSTAAEAVGRAERDAGRFAGVVAVSQTVDEATGDIAEEPRILARHGQLPAEFNEE